MSEEVCTLAEVGSDLLSRAQITIRGRNEPMAVRMTEDPTVLTGLLREDAIAHGEFVGETQELAPSP